MTAKKKMSNCLIFACFGMHKNRKKYKKYLIDEKSDRMEQSELCMSRKVTTDYDGSMSSGYPISVEATVKPFKMKQEVQSIEVHGSIKEHSCEKTKSCSSQENLVKAIIDCGVCTVSLYQGATLKIENGAITVSTSVMDKNKEEHGKMWHCKPKACEVEKKRNNVQKPFHVNNCRPETGEEEHATCNTKLTAVIPPTFSECNAVGRVSNIFANDWHSLSDEDNYLSILENSSLHIEGVTVPQSEDTTVKHIYSSNSALSMSLGGSETNISSPEERGSISLEASSFPSFDTWSSVGRETLLEPENIGADTKNVNCFQDQTINIGHTNKTFVENGMFNTQAELLGNFTIVECRKAADSSESIEKADEESCLKQVTKDKFIPCNNTVVTSGREMVGDKLGNKQNTEKDETVRSDCKLKVEEADICSSASTADESCLHEKENVMSLSCSTLKVMDTVNCLFADACNESHPTQKDKVYVTPVKTASFGYYRYHDMDSVISDQKYASGYGIPAQHCEESWQMHVSFGYSSHHYIEGEELVKDTSIKELTKDGLSNKDCDLNKPKSETFVSISKVQEGKVSEIRAILNKKKSVRRPKLGITYKHYPLAKKRRGRKRKVKIKGHIKPSRKGSFKKKIPRILRDLKINLHFLASSFAQDTVQGNTLTQTTNMGKRKPYFLTEHNVVVSKKENGSQERLIDDFLQSLASTWFIFPTIRNGSQTVILLPTGLQLYFERLLRGSPPDEREMMSYEWLRLQTFINYPSPGSAIRLSRAGFYYSGNGTVTVCYACGRQHSGWNFHDDPFEIHRRISPDCPFLRGNPTYPNVPIMQEREQIGIDMVSTSSNAPLSQTQNITMTNSPSISNRTSDEMLRPTAFQLQNSANTQAQSSAATSPSIQNPQKGESEEHVSQQTTSQAEHFLGTDPSPINSEILSVKPVERIATVLPSTSGKSHQGQSPPATASSVTQPQQPTDDAENTQYRNPGNFVRIKPAGQVEDPGVDPMPQTMSERPRHPEYAPLSSRVNSYSGWPARLDQTPQQMAEAGLFYAGINDYTRCFQCGGGLRNWEPGDNPWIEHARWYPQCAYVLGKRGHKFVAAVLKKQAELLAAQNAERNNSNTTTTNTSSLAVSKTGTQSAQEPATQSGRPRYFQNPNENEIANILINEMGYQQERVREAILEVKRTRGQQEIAVEHVIELLIADEERRARAGRQNEAATLEELIQESGKLTLHDDCNAQPSVPSPTANETATRTQKSILNQVAGNRSSGQQSSEQTNQTSAPERAPSIPQSQLNMPGPRSIAFDVPSSSAIFSNQEGSQNNKSTASNTPLLESTSLPAFDAESLREEYLRLLDQNICKICMERNVELAFLPCGHLVCCEVCGQTLRFCPICRAKIHASVKTYLS